MKFFTKELWLATQEAEHIAETNRRWDRAAAEYQSQLDALDSRVSPTAFEFFSDPNVHDGEILEFAVRNDSRTVPLDSPPWGRQPPPTEHHPVKANLTILDESNKYVWHLSYRNVRCVLTDWPSTEPLFYADGDGLGAWGYHELTDADNGFLRHEILLATGGTILLEFKTIDVSRGPRTFRFAEGLQGA
jgi:hypothetical protein